jgi:hypothetical protein
MHRKLRRNAEGGWRAAHMFHSAPNMAPAVARCAKGTNLQASVGRAGLSVMEIGAELAAEMKGKRLTGCAQRHLNMMTLAKGQYASPVVHVGITHDCSLACTRASRSYAQLCERMRCLHLNVCNALAVIEQYPSESGG